MRAGLPYMVSHSQGHANGALEYEGGALGGGGVGWGGESHHRAFASCATRPSMQLHELCFHAPATARAAADSRGKLNEVVILRLGGQDVTDIH